MREDTLLDLWTAEIHREFSDHRDPDSGLSKDCPSCRALAMRLFDIQTEIALIEGEINFRQLAGR